MATRQTLRPKTRTSRSTAQLNHGKNTAGTVDDKDQGNVGPPAFEPLLRRCPTHRRIEHRDWALRSMRPEQVGNAKAQQLTFRRDCFS